MAKTVLLIMAHGVFGWGADKVQAEDQIRDYYYGIKTFLEDEYGPIKRPDIRLVTVAPSVPPSENVAGRGAVLLGAIQEAMKNCAPGTRAHILAHSMGGLDARWAIVQPELKGRIASLTTIAAPHRGTTLGNLAQAEAPLLFRIGGVLDFFYWIWRLVWRYFPIRQANPDQIILLGQLLHNLAGSTLGQVQRGLYALTLEGASKFNKQQAQAEEQTRTNVVYFSYGGKAQPGQIGMLKPSHEILEHFGTAEEKQSGNDGAVSVWSAHYPWDDGGQDYARTIPFDHFMQVNWRIPDPRPKPDMNDDLKAVYRDIMNNILRVQQS